MGFGKDEGNRFAALICPLRGGRQHLLMTPPSVTGCRLKLKHALRITEGISLSRGVVFMLS